MELCKNKALKLYAQKMIGENLHPELQQFDLGGNNCTVFCRFGSCDDLTFSPAVVMGRFPLLDVSPCFSLQ
jgi:hypothetical protein